MAKSHNRLNAFIHTSKRFIRPFGAVYQCVTEVDLNLPLWFSERDIGHEGRDDEY